MDQDLIGANKKHSNRHREHWGRLTDDDLDIVEGRRELLVDKLQTKFGISREEANRRYLEFEQRDFAST